MNILKILKYLWYGNKRILQTIFRSDRIKGHLIILAREENGEWFTLVDKKNALVANSTTLIAKALAGETGWVIDSIIAMKANAILATGTTTYTFPSPNQVQFQTLFGFSDFNDTLDEVRLSSVVGGDFSAVTGLSVAKPNTLQLNIKWLLTIL